MSLLAPPYEKEVLVENVLPRKTLKKPPKLTSIAGFYKTPDIDP